MSAVKSLIYIVSSVYYFYDSMALSERWKRFLWTSNGEERHETRRKTIYLSSTLLLSTSDDCHNYPLNG